jgi:hypothetical protein
MFLKTFSRLCLLGLLCCFVIGNSDVAAQKRKPNAKKKAAPKKKSNLPAKLPKVRKKPAVNLLKATLGL